MLRGLRKPSGAEAPDARVTSTDEGAAAAIGVLFCRKRPKTPNCGKIASIYFAKTSKNAELRHKVTAFIEETRCRSSVHLTLVTTYALARNEYSGQVQSVVTMDDLFAPGR